MFGSSVQCGENFCIGPIPIMSIYFTCALKISEAKYHDISIYKDNTLYKKEFQRGLTEVMIPDSLGSYMTVLNDLCGMDIATSILSLCGKSVILHK